MSMKLLIVDDEYEILTWLEEMFRYDFEPVIEVCTASSAYEALAWLNKVNFDVVLTDIKMPGMDGLTLFQKNKANWPRCKTVFLTGYPNFEDMYRIIRHKDVRYILKSEDDDVIMKTVREALEEQKQEMEQEVLLQQHSQDMEKVRTWMRQDFFCSLLKGEMEETGEDALLSRAREAGFGIDLNRPFLLFTARIDAEKEKKPDKTGPLLEMVSRSVKNALPERLLLETCPVDGRWTAGAVQLDASSPPDVKRLFALIRGAIEYAQSFFERLSGRTFSAAIESTALSGPEVPNMFFRMKQILGGGLSREKAVAAHVETVNAASDGDGSGKSMSRIVMLKTHLEMKQRQAYFSILDDACRELLTCTTLGDPRGLGIYYSMSVTLLQFIQENQLEGRLPPAVSLYGLTRMDEHRSWYEAAQYVYDVSTAVFEALDTPDSSISDRALRRICDYIDQNPEKDLSLTALADIGGFNASYLSRLFRQKYDITVTDYVKEKRMKLASLLLKTTNDRIQDIAEKTGYLSSQSFARAFRSHFSISAAEYREINRPRK